MTTVLIFPVNPVGRDLITNAMQHNRYRTMLDPRIDRMGKQLLDLQGLTTNRGWWILLPERGIFRSG